MDVDAWNGKLWTIHVPENGLCHRPALDRAASDHGFRAHLVEVLWGRERETPTAEAKVGGYVYEIADRLATALEADLLACPPAWKCVCGHINEGLWSTRGNTCEGCLVAAAEPSDVDGHYRLVPTPAENGVIAARLGAEVALARGRRLHPTPAELVASNAESDVLCPECICPAPCPTRRALDGESVTLPEVQHSKGE